MSCGQSYKNELKQKSNVIYELRNFEKIFYIFLVLKDISIEEISEFLESNGEENSRYYLNDYLNSIIDRKEDFSICLIQFLLNKFENEIPHYLIVLITHLTQKKMKFDRLGI